MAVSGIAFQQAHHYERIRSGEPFSIVYHLEENEWKNKVTLQLNVKDIKFEED
jgi:single-stranded-DNA-specific exonuclease